MKKAKWLRSVTLIALLALVIAACGGDGGTTTTEAAEPEEETPATTEAPEETPDTTAAPDETTPEASGDALTFGGLLPETGSLAFLGPPEIAGAMLAEEDINAAGGVLGNDVVWIPGDSGDLSTDTANVTTDAHLAAGVHAIIGAASSGVSLTVIDKIVGAGVIMFSPANTSQEFTDYDDDGLYFRTAPSDYLQGQVLAELVLNSGQLSASVIYRQESYGEGLALRFQEVYESIGGEIAAFIAYPPEGHTNFDAEVEELVQADADAIIAITFDEGALLFETMHERGISPVLGTPAWGSDGNIGGLHLAFEDAGSASILEGFRGTTPSVDLASISEFTERLDAIYPGGLGGIHAYGAETYDSMVITALAAETAGSLDPTAIAAEINDVTRGGTKCFSFEECVEMVRAGEDIDYDGIGGPYDFTDDGDPSIASYQVITYGDAGPDPSLDEFIIAELQ